MCPRQNRNTELAPMKEVKLELIYKKNMKPSQVVNKASVQYGELTFMIEVIQQTATF